MPGTAKTKAFNLSQATVMIGPTADLWDLNPNDHSIGLVKNFTMQSEPEYTELTQGVKNQIVYSVMTNHRVTASMEVYEFTSKNLAYGMNLDGSSLVASATHTLKTSVLADASVLIVDDATPFAANDTLMIQEAFSDKVHVSPVLSVTTSGGDQEVTIARDVPTAFAAGSRIWKVNVINVGADTTDQFFSAKVVPVLPENRRPLAILIPKIRVTRGLSLAFQSDNFGNMPFEFTPYELAGDDPFLADFPGLLAKVYNPN